MKNLPLVSFDRDKKIIGQPDFWEKIGLLGIGLLRIGFGRTVKVQLASDSNEGFHFEEQAYPTSKRVAAVVLAIFTFPLTIISTLIGCIGLKYYSISYGKMFKPYQAQEEIIRRLNQREKIKDLFPKGSQSLLSFINNLSREQKGKIKVLDFRDYSIENGYVYKVVSACYNLREFYIKKCSEVEDWTFEHIVFDCIKNCQNLRKLHLENCSEVTDAQLYSLKDCLNQRDLRDLTLTGCKRITDKGLKHIANVLYLKNWYFIRPLRYLTLTGCEEITDKGLEHLAECSNLSSLHLDRCPKVTDKGLEHLSKCRNLHGLYLYGCEQITNKGLEHIANYKNLGSLHLDYCPKVTDKGLEHLSKCPKLWDLHLQSFDQITDAGLVHLAKPKKLRYFYYVSCPNITTAGMDKFEALNPRCSTL